MPVTTTIVNPEAIRQALQAEKEQWSRLKSFFNLNQELVDSFAGEPFYSIGCFAGLLSFITCNCKYKANNFAEFMLFEKQHRKCLALIRKVDDVTTLSQTQLNAIFSYVMGRNVLVKPFIDEIFYNIYNPPIKKTDNEEPND